MPIAEEKPVSSEIKKPERKISSATGKLSEDKSAAERKRKPRTITCYICGREFGSASFPIHEPKCLQVFGIFVTNS